VQYAETGSFPVPGDVVVARFQVSADPNEADDTSEQPIFRMAKPSAQVGTSEAYHNGGTIAFGTDGLLWMPTGDGAGWFGNDPNNCAQNGSSVLGKLLRITVGLVPPAGVTA
jgi:glucose/arabinose dehydrogenase